MGLELRISIAKRLLLAAGLMLFAAPAYAACTTTGATSITTSGLYTVSGDGVFVTGGPIGGDGLQFEDTAGAPVDTLALTSDDAITSTGDGIVTGSGIDISGTFGVVCYDGKASGDIDADLDGLRVNQAGDGDTLLTIAHTIIADGAGISVLRDPSSNGDIDIESNGDIQSTESGIEAVHIGNAGDISIATSAGTTISTHGGLGPTFEGGIGIYVYREGGLDSDITVTNGADIDADAAGIYLELCDCSDADVLIDSTGTIDVDSGEGIHVDKGASGDTTVKQSGAVTVADGSGIVVEQDGSGDVLVETGGDIDVTDTGIEVGHLGQTGTITITTSAGSTITADGGTGVGIDAIREYTLGTGSGGIVINNGADIVSDFLGINASVCGCAPGDISITSTGSIDITGGDAGIVASQEGDGTVTVNATGQISAIGGAAVGIVVAKDDGGAVDITSGDITVGDTGILALSVDDADVTIHANGDIVAPIGIEATSGAGGSVTLNLAGTITAEQGIAVSADTVTATIASGATITVSSGGGCGCPTHGATFDSTLSKVTVGGTIDATGSDALLFDGGDAQLTLLPGFLIHGQVDALAGTNDQLRFGGSGTGTFDLDSVGAQYTGFDALLKTGGSDWTFTGPGFTGALTAQNGIVRVNTAIPGLDLVLTGNGTFKGTGEIGSLTTTGGTIAPGNSIGTVVVAGNVNIGAGTIYEVEISPTLSDLLDAGGTVTIDPGADVLVVPEPGVYTDPTTYTIITAGTSVNGAFGGATTTSAFYDASLSYDPAAVRLTLFRNANTLSTFARTPNQKAVAAALGAGGAAIPYRTAILGLGAAAVPGALDALSGDGYASLATAALDDGRFVRDAALGRRGARGVWASPYGGLSHLPGDGNGPGVDHATGGLLLGADSAFGDGWLGLLLGYGQSRFDIPGRDMSATSGEFSLGAYGGTQWDAFYASFGAALTGRDIEATREVNFAGISDTFTAGYAALTAQAFTELGYRLDMGGATVTPFGGLAALYTATSGYTENGTGAGALTVDAGAANALVATLGVRLEHELMLEGGDTLALRASAAWRHAIGGASTANAMTGTGAFTVAGAPPAPDTLVLAAGTALDMGQLSVALDLTGSYGSGGLSHAATATVAGTF